MTQGPLGIDLAREESRIEAFLRRQVSGAKAGGVVLGVSGGIDSAVVCATAARALGGERVLGVLMPSPSTPEADMADARALVASLGVDERVVPIGALAEQLKGALGAAPPRVVGANVQARLRMAVLYMFANATSRLVAGTGDRSELEIGYFTKYGDGGADLLPIAHLYKTQVRALGKHLGLPRELVGKPSSPQLWPGQKAVDEIPADYDRLDVVLHAILDEGRSAAAAAQEAGVARGVVDRVLEMRSSSAHKRSLPPRLRPPSGR